MTSSTTAISVIVPTYKEGPNIRALVERVNAACSEAGVAFEIIFVDDDSQDEIEDVVQELGKLFDVSVLVRKGRRGLSSAVLEGFQKARHDILAVMDGDLQHPPETLVKLAGALVESSHDFAIATRYVAFGGISEDWPWHRRLISRVARFMARPLTPMSDPLSGFFALPRSVWENAKPLSPIGYKIALEMYVKGGCRNPVEVPFVFQVRHAGSSKLTLAQQVNYVVHLWRLYWFRFPVQCGILVLAILGVLVWFFAG